MSDDPEEPAELTAEQVAQIRKNARFEAALFGCYTCCCLFVFSAVDIAALIVASSESINCDKRGDFFVKPKPYLKIAGSFSLGFGALTLAMHCLLTAETNVSHFLDNSRQLSLASRRFYSTAVLSALFSIAWGIVGLRLFHRMSDRSCRSPEGMILAWALIHFVTGLFPMMSVCWGDSLLFIICEPNRVPPNRQTVKSKRRDRNERVTYVEETPRIVQSAITPLARDEVDETKEEIEEAGDHADDMVVQTDIKEDDDNDDEDQTLLGGTPAQQSTAVDTDDDGVRDSGVVPVESSPELDTEQQQ